MAVKLKSNAGKHLIVKPSLFLLCGNEEKELDSMFWEIESKLVQIKSPNVDALISVSRKMKNREEKYSFWQLSHLVSNYSSTILKFLLSFMTK